jgi:hypothetical protein
MTKNGIPTMAAWDNQPSVRIGGRVREIVVAFLVMTVPMTIFSGLLLGLIFYYRIIQNEFAFSNLAFDSGHNDAGYIFVRLSATTLIVIASWSSTIAPILVGFAVTLISYPVARGILSASEKSHVAGLPTPYQLTLMLRMLSSASPSSLWGWLQYHFGWSGKRTAHCTPIKILTSILVLGNLLT